MYKTECPSCGAGVRGDNYGHFVAYECHEHGRFKVSESAAEAWASANRDDRLRVLSLAKASSNPPLVLREHFDSV